MKKSGFFILVLIYAGVTNGYSQIAKGATLFGGGVNYSASGIIEAESQASSFKIISNFSKFLSDKESFGLGLGYQVDKRKEFDGYIGEEIEYTESQLFINPSFRIYRALNERFYTYLETGASFGLGKYKSSVEDDDRPKLRNISVGISPGLSFFPSNKVSIDFRFNLIGVSSYTFSYIDFNGNTKKSKSSQLNVGFDSLSPMIGVYFIL